MSETMALAAVAAPLDEPEPLHPTIICGELRTGRILTEIPCETATWSVLHNDAGQITCDIPLKGIDPTKRDVAELVGYLDIARCYLAVRVGDLIVEAGPIWRHDYTDNADGTLKVTAAGLWSLFDHRKVMKVLADGESPAATSVGWSALGLGTIAKRLVELAVSHIGGSLPLAFQADETASADADHTRTYQGYSLTPVGEALKQLTGVINGPDIDFAPRLTADRQHIEWLMRTGTEADPLLHQQGDDYHWDIGVPQSGVSGLSVVRDGTALGYRAWVPGAGTQTGQQMSMREDLVALDAGYPMLEVDEAHPSTIEQTTLDAHADALVTRSVRSWVTLSWDAPVSDPPVLGTVRPGDWGRADVPDGHVYLAALTTAGSIRARVMSISGDLGPSAHWAAAPTMEAR